LHSSTTGIYTGDITWVTDDMYGTVTDDGVRQSNVGLGPAGIGMIILGLLLLLCKYCIESLLRHIRIAKYI
jgi:desmoglein 4